MQMRASGSVGEWSVSFERQLRHATIDFAARLPLLVGRPDRLGHQSTGELRHDGIVSAAHRRARCGEYCAHVLHRGGAIEGGGGERGGEPRPGQGRRLRARAGHPARARQLRGAAGRPRHRRDLHPAAQQHARRMGDPRRRGRQARAVREADRHVGRRDQVDVRRRAPPQGDPARGLSVHGPAARDDLARRGSRRARSARCG